MNVLRKLSGGTVLNDVSIVDLLKVLLTVSGGIVAAFITARLSRRSQAETNKVVEANGIVERYNTLTADLVRQKDEALAESKHRGKQISLWRRYAHDLRAQIYQLSGKPAEADENLEL